nr:hypothetical protein [Pandoravirus massiliensis]
MRFCLLSEKVGLCMCGIGPVPNRALQHGPIRPNPTRRAFVVSFFSNKILRKHTLFIFLPIERIGLLIRLHRQRWRSFFLKISSREKRLFDQRKRHNTNTPRE